MTAYKVKALRIIGRAAAAAACLFLLTGGSGRLSNAAEEKTPGQSPWEAIEALMGGGPAPTAAPSDEKSSDERPPSIESDKPSPEESAEPAPSQAEKKDAEDAESKQPATPPTPQDKPQSPKEDRATLTKQARELEKKGDHSAALEKFRQALKGVDDKTDQRIVAAALDGMARTAFELGRDQEALGFVRRSIATHQILKNARSRSLAYLLAGRILMKQSHYSEAQKSFEECLKILPNSEAAHRHQLLEDMASCMVKQNHHAEALTAYGQLLAILTKEGNEKECGRILLVMGDIQASRSEYRGARASFKKAEEIFRKLKLKEELGNTLFRLAHPDQVHGKIEAAGKAVEEGQTPVAPKASAGSNALPLMVSGMNHHKKGEVVQAVRNLTLALNQYREAGDRLMAARARLALGNVDNDRSRMKSALDHGGEALKEFRSLSDQSGEAGALLLIGKVYFKQGFVQKAQEYAQDSLAIAKKTNDRGPAAKARVLLAQIHTALGESDFAWKLLKEAVDDSTGGTDANTRGRVRLAVARYQLTREASENALKTASAARKDFIDTEDVRGSADCDHLMGQVYELRGDRKKAQELFDRALRGHRSMWDLYGEGLDLTALGVHFKNLGEYEKALENFRMALDLHKRIGDLRGQAAGMTNIGNLLKHQGQGPEAQRNLEQALDMYREMSDKKGEADALTNLANVHAAGRSQAAALDKLTSALEIHREIHDLRGVATDLTSIGKLYLERGDLENAAKNLDEADKVNKRISNPRGEVAILAEAAMLQRARRNTQQAMALLQKALKLAQSMGDARAVSSIRLKTASVLQDSGNYNEALTLLRETLDMMRKQGDRRGELWALGETGIIQVKIQDYENALANLHRALELRTELGVPASQARDLDLYLGEIYEGFKDYERALEHYHKALDLAQISGTEVMLGRVYHRIGNIYYQIEEYEKAGEFFEDALRVHSETKNVPMQKIELIRFGDIMSKLGKPDEALRYQLRALALTKESGDTKTEPRVLTRIGTLYQVLGRPKIALEYYNEAKEKRSLQGDRRGVNENLLQLALVKSILGDFDSAVVSLRSAFELSHSSEDRSMLWKAYFIMGRALQGKNRFGEALESYRKALAILEAMEADIIEESDEDNFIFGGKTALFETTLNVLMKLARKDPEGAYDSQALRIVEKLKAASFENSLAQTNVPGFADLPQELLIKEKSLKLNLRKLNERIARELSTEKPDQGQIKKLVQERQEKEKAFMQLKARLVNEYPAYAALRYPGPVSIHQIQKEILDPNEVILEYMVTRSRSYLFAIDKNRFQTYSR